MPTINGRACVANGRNLLQGTNQGLTNWTFSADRSGGQYAKYAFDVPNGQGITMTTTVAYTNWFWIGYNLDYTALKQNTDYVLSFWAKSTDIDRTISARFANGAGSNTAAFFGAVSLKSGVKTKVVLRATTNDVKFTDQYLYLSQFNMVGGIDIWDLKIETGNTATPYSPAPVDKVFSNGQQVYGRNYFLNSKTRTITPPGTANWDWRIFISDDFWSNSDRLKPNSIRVIFTLTAQKALTEDFTSFLYFSATPWPSKPFNYPVGTTAPQKYELVFNITDSAFKTDNCFIRFRANNTSANPFILENAKLEIGTTATPWTPAPEDVM